LEPERFRKGSWTFVLCGTVPSSEEGDLAPRGTEGRAAALPRGWELQHLPAEGFLAMRLPPREDGKGRAGIERLMSKEKGLPRLCWPRCRDSTLLRPVKKGRYAAKAALNREGEKREEYVLNPKKKGCFGRPSAQEKEREEGLSKTRCSRREKKGRV